MSPSCRPVMFWRDLDAYWKPHLKQHSIDWRLFVRFGALPALTGLVSGRYLGKFVGHVPRFCLIWPGRAFLDVLEKHRAFLDFSRERHDLLRVNHECESAVCAAFWHATSTRGSRTPARRLKRNLHDARTNQHTKLIVVVGQPPSTSPTLFDQFTFQNGSINYSETVSHHKPFKMKDAERCGWRLWWKHRGNEIEVHEDWLANCLPMYFQRGAFSAMAPTSLFARFLWWAARFVTCRWPHAAGNFTDSLLFFWFLFYPLSLAMIYACLRRPKNQSGIFGKTKIMDKNSEKLFEKGGKKGRNRKTREGANERRSRGNPGGQQRRQRERHGGRAVQHPRGCRRRERHGRCAVQHRHALLPLFTEDNILTPIFTIGTEYAQINIHVLIVNLIAPVVF